MTDLVSGFGRMHPALTQQSVLSSSAGADSAPAAGAVNFQDVLLSSLEQVNQYDKQAQAAIAGGLADNDLTQAEIFTAVKKADLAFRTMMQIRNKILDAYNEIKQMRI